MLQTALTSPGQNFISNPDKLFDYGTTIFIILGAVLVLALFIFAFFLWRKSHHQYKQGLRYSFLAVTNSQADETKIDAASQLFASLTSLTKTGLQAITTGQEDLSFEIVSQNGEIVFYVAVPHELKDFIAKKINSFYPASVVTEVPEYNLFSNPGHLEAEELHLSKASFYPLTTYKSLEGADPLNNLTQALSKLEPGEAAAVQVLIAPTGSSWHSGGLGFLTKAKAPAQEGKTKHVVSEELVKAVEAKIAQPGFDTYIRILVNAKSKTSAKLKLADIKGAFAQYNSPIGNRFQGLGPVSRIFRRKQVLKNFLYRIMPVIFGKTVLTSDELGTIWHLPGKAVTTPGIRWAGAKQAAAPVSTPAEGLYLGTSNFQGQSQPVFILPDDRRRHLYIIGQTGTGKSEFLKFMAVQDIKAGHGVAFIDPHGTAIEDILQQIPPNRMGDVVYFDAGDRDRPMGLNILEAENEDQQHMIVNSFIALLYKLYDPNKQGIMGPQLERAVRNVLLTAMSEPGNTMVEVMRLLTDPKFAEGMISKIKDPLVKRYWTDEMAQTSDFHKSEKMGYFVSKFDRFVTEKLMRNIIGQSQSAFNFKDIMQNRKILLVDLSKGKIGEENSNFLGLLLVPRILAAAMARGSGDNPDFYLYVDEFQNFATDSFETILSEARKYRLNLTVANQFIAQLPDEIKNAVFGNVGTLAAFRVGPDDAEYLETQFDPVFKKEDLISNPVGQAYLKLLIKGSPSSPFSLVSDWPRMQSSPRDKLLAQKIKDYSRQTYGRDAGEVEAEIAKRAQLDVTVHGAEATPM